MAAAPRYMNTVSQFLFAKPHIIYYSVRSTDTSVPILTEKPCADNLHLIRKMLYTHSTIITVNATRDIILDGAILVDGNRIKDIGKTIDLVDKYPLEIAKDLSGRIIIPGLISTHMHTAQTLLRG